MTLQSTVRVLAPALLFVSFLAAQGPYYVNGLTGADAPTHGLSPTMPWRTLTHALANVPAQTPSTSTILYVEGNQVYSPTTNGETFPLVPAYNVSIEGTFVGHGRMPVFRAPAGGTTFAFPGNVFFNRNQVTFRYLVVEEGSYGITMGAAPGFRHRPRVQDCTFRNQTGAGIRITNSGSAINDPRFFQNLFTGPGKGIEMFSVGNGAVTQPDVEENRFQNLGGRAIDCEDQSPGGGNVGGIFRSNWFDTCGDGIRIRSSAGAVATNATIRTSRFANIPGSAISILIDRPFDPNVTVDQCAILNCGTGIEMNGFPLPGSYTLTMTKNVVRSCTTGVALYLSGQGSIAVTSNDNLVEACGKGLDVFVNSSGSPAMLFNLQVLRDRYLDCPTGIVLGGTTPGLLSVQSTLVARSPNYGFRVATGTTTTIRSVTVADCFIGITSGLLGPSSAFDHMVFGGNTFDATTAGGTIFNHSCFQGSTQLGAGNLNLTNPQLVRPYYKLAPASPCRDVGNVAYALPATDHEGDPRSSVSAAGGQPLPDLGADEYVQTGSIRRYGTGGFGLFNVFPRISSPNTTVLPGGSVAVNLEGAIMPVFGVRATWALLSFGWTDSSNPLPFDLAQFGQPGSYLWNEFATSFPLQPVSTTGTASYTQSIPAVASLAGLTFTYQWFALMPGQYGIISSDGLRATVGL
ncbi:MAG: Right handed beta helix region [Planctomycetota bacterium]|jgi:hypothetical protein